MSTPIRCAIYTRKSSEEGLEQSYNSLDAQRDACSAYVLSQTGEGWSLLPQSYDDGGWSGGTMERPALQRLLADIQARRVDVVVVYKVDRLTRSLADFARIVEVLDGHGASFVSVTQAFNTTTSMGRLTLNVLLSFAQFEREVTGERIRDKIAASKKLGMWMGGIVPLGYRAAGRTLEIEAAEADLVRHIFRRYLELGSVHRLRDELQAEGVVSKRRISRSGRQSGGRPFDRGALYHLLRNPLYLGEVRHKERTYKGQHPAIVDRPLFLAVQQALQAGAAISCTARLSPGQGGAEPRHHAVRIKAPLTGLLFGGDGARMSPVRARKRGGAVYRYYVSQPLQTGSRSVTGEARRVNAVALEDQIYRVLSRLGLAPTGVTTPDWGAVRPHLRRVQIAGPLLRITVVAGGALRALVADATALRNRLGEDVEQSTSEDSITLALPLSRARRSGAALSYSPPGTSAVERHASDPVLVSALIRAEAWKRRLFAGEAASVHAIARAEAVTAAYIARLLHLAFLAPALKRQILDGRQPDGLTLQRLVTHPIPLAWAEQQALFRT